MFILNRKHVCCCKIHMHVYVDVHTRDLRIALYQHLVSGFANTDEAGSDSSDVFLIDHR